MVGTPRPVSYWLRAEPASWKRRFGLTGQDKDAARLLAIQRFPAAALQLQRKKDNGRADALLIGLWAEHQLAMGQAAGTAAALAADTHCTPRSLSANALREALERQDVIL